MERYTLEGIDEEYLDFVFAVAVHLLKKDENSQAGVLIVDAPTVQKLNKRFRGLDKPANILSFAYQEIRDDRQFLTAAEEALYLGDIYICYDEVVKKAAKEKRSEKDVFTALFVHGIMHLFGYDHQTDNEAIDMEMLENKILEIVSKV